MTKHKASKQRLASVDRAVQAIELRRAGLTFQQIADRLGYMNRAGAWHAVQTGLRMALETPSRELIGLEVERLDALQASVWDRALGGDMKAIDRVISIMRRRAKLLGLDAPRAVAVGGAVPPWRLVEVVAQEEGRDPEAVWSEAEELFSRITEGDERE
jgi:hypothetical protein